MTKKSISLNQNNGIITFKNTGGNIVFNDFI